MRALTKAVTSAMLTLTAGLALGDVVREGSGHRRAQLDAMELTPFPGGAWGTLVDWTGGAALTSETMNGKPVLICTWASWYPTSVSQGLKAAQEMASRFEAQGLIVVGVHHDQGWEGAAAAAQKAGAKFAIVRDAGGTFRSALKVDQDPDFYVVDRAGNLRFADITSGSLEEAVRTVVAETPDLAAAEPQATKDRAAGVRAEALRSHSIRANLELGGLPPVPPGFTPPAPEAFDAARWPAIPEEYGKRVGLLDQTTGRPVKQALSVSPSGWQPAMPTFEGRAVVAYVWNPKLQEGASGYRMFDVMDRLQQKHVRDLVVIGAYTPLTIVNNNSGFGAPTEDEADQAKRLENFVRSRTFKHTLAADLSGSVINSLPQGSRQGLPYPLGIIASSDGTIRYIGAATSPNFEAVLAQVMESDPGVRLRRKLDQKYIEEMQK